MQTEFVGAQKACIVSCGMKLDQRLSWLHIQASENNSIPGNVQGNRSSSNAAWQFSGTFIDIQQCTTRLICSQSNTSEALVQTLTRVAEPQIPLIRIMHIMEAAQNTSTSLP